MINNDRIVPITSMDFLSMIGTLKNLSFFTNKVPEQFQPYAGENGVFDIADGGAYILNEPAKKITVNSTVSDLALLFVPDYDWGGAYMYDAESETVSEIEGAEVNADGISLYMIGDGGILKLTPDAPEA